MIQNKVGSMVYLMEEVIVLVQSNTQFINWLNTLPFTRSMNQSGLLKNQLYV